MIDSRFGNTADNSRGDGVQRVPPNHKQPWDFVEEIVGILKTGFPLLALTLETIQDQLKQRFKPSTDEDTYRILNNAVAAGLSVRFIILR